MRRGLLATVCAVALVALAGCASGNNTGPGDASSAAGGVTVWGYLTWPASMPDQPTQECGFPCDHTLTMPEPGPYESTAATNVCDAQGASVRQNAPQVVVKDASGNLLAAAQVTWADYQTLVGPRDNAAGSFHCFAKWTAPQLPNAAVYVVTCGSGQVVVNRADVGNQVDFYVNGVNS
jgi:hypothetical protein